jgi:hypothetical protein
LQAGDTPAGIVALERALDGPAFEAPDEDGLIAFSFTDEGHLIFGVNSLGAVGLLIFAYARAGRDDDALDLAAETHRVVGAEGFLVFQMLLLRDAERWVDLVEAAAGHDPTDGARLEIRLLQGQALEELDRFDEAMQVYDGLARLGTALNPDEELPWLTEAALRRDRLAAAGVFLPDAELDDDTKALADEPRYSPLRQAELPADAALAPGPPSTPMPAPQGFQYEGAVFLELDAQVLSGSVALRHGFVESRNRWIQMVVDDGPKAALQELALAMNTAGADDLVWQRLFAGLIGCAAGGEDAPKLLAEALRDPQASRYLAAVSRWFDGMVSVSIGETHVLTSSHTDSLILPLAALPFRALRSRRAGPLRCCCQAMAIARPAAGRP